MELEGANVVVAAQTFLSPRDKGLHIIIQCDNLARVQVFCTSKARNPVLLEALDVASSSGQIHLLFAYKRGR